MKKLYYTIGEVSNLLGVQPHVIRYWESEFPFLKPKKSPGHIRKFGEEHILLLRKIHDLLYNQRFTIEGARQKLKQDRQSIKALSKAETPLPATQQTTTYNPELKQALGKLRANLEELKQLCKQYSEN